MRAITQPDSSAPNFFISPRDRDMLIRTVAGEAGNQPDIGRIAVAHSILNRLVSGQYGATVSDIVTANNGRTYQYEPWGSRRGELLGMSPDSPAYQRSAQAVDLALSGQAPDPTNGATHFANVSTVQQRGDAAGRPGGWLSKMQNVSDIFAHRFGNPDGPPVTWSSLKGQPSPSAPAPAAKPAVASGLAPTPPAQSSAPSDGSLGDDEIDALLSGKAPGSAPAPAGLAPVPVTVAPNKPGTDPNAPPAPADDSTPMVVTVRPSGTSGKKPAPAAAMVAPPPAGPAQPNANVATGALSDGDIDALLTGKTPAPNASANLAPASASGAPNPQTAAGGAPSASAAPAPSFGQRVADTAGSFAAGALDLPIVGPAVRNALIEAASYARQKVNGETPDQARANALAKYSQVTDDHPWANTAGNIAGNVAAFAPAAMAAPAAFGVTGSNMYARVGASALTNALLGAGDSTVRAGTPQSAYLPPSLDLSAARDGAIKGGIGGAIAPPIGAAAGAGVNKIMGLFGRGAATPAEANVAGLLKEIGITPQEAQARLQRMGPNATLADLDPALTVDAGALAARGGAPTSTLKNAMAGRAADANDRVAQMMDSALGPKPDLTQELDAGLARAQRASSPYYEAARQSRTGFDVDPIIQDIDKRLNTAAGGEADVLNRVKGFLTTKDGLPKISPDAVLKARQAIDDLVERLPQAETSAGKNALRTLKGLRGQVDAELKTDPNIRAGDAAYAGEMTLRDAMTEGTELFQRGTRPEDFARRLQKAEPGEVDALRSGARVAIGDALEQARRGELQGAKQMFGSGSANRTKLQMLFPKAGEVLDALQNEAAMRATEQRVAANSATAERLASAKRYQVPGNQPSMGNDLLAVAGGMAMGDPTGGVLPAMARRGFGYVKGGMSERAYDDLAASTARGYAAMGPERDAFLNRLMNAGNANDPGLIANMTGNLLTDATGREYPRMIHKTGSGSPIRAWR